MEEKPLQEMSETELEALMDTLVQEREVLRTKLVDVCNKIRTKAHARQVKAQAGAKNDNPNRVTAA